MRANGQTGGATTSKQGMADLYRRLKQAGYGRRFVQERILPDWWDDSLAEVPANRALAELSISRMIGFPIAALKNPDCQLGRPPTTTFRLKRRKGATPSEVSPSVVLAKRMAEAIVPNLKNTSAFTPGPNAEQIRHAILADRPYVDLEALLHYCWERGVVVFHVAELPVVQGISKKITGLAFFVEQTPVIVLGSKRDSPPWLAFHLAHEMGHVFLEHVKAGGPILADSEIDAMVKDPEEDEADRFACTVLTGRPQIEAAPIPGWTAEVLARVARQHATPRRVDPGVMVLFYGRNADRLPAAQNALKRLGADQGAQRQIAAALRHRLRDDLPETTERFVQLAVNA